MVSHIKIIVTKNTWFCTVKKKRTDCKEQGKGWGREEFCLLPNMCESGYEKERREATMQAKDTESTGKKACMLETKTWEKKENKKVAPVAPGGPGASNPGWGLHNCQQQWRNPGSSLLSSLLLNLSRPPSPLPSLSHFLIQKMNHTCLKGTLEFFLFLFHSHKKVSKRGET